MTSELYFCSQCGTPWLQEAAVMCSICGADQDRRSLREVTPHEERQEETESVHETRLLNTEQLRSRPKPVWLVENLLPESGIGQLFGASGSYKTFVSIGLAMAICNTTPDESQAWFGHRVNLGGDVIYVAMEGAFDFVDRIDAWLLAHKGASDARLLVLMEEELNLGDPASVARLWSDASGPGVEPSLVVIDTQALATPGVDENSNTEMGLVLSNVKRLAQVLGCFVLLVHHTGWQNNRVRGASAQIAAMDFVAGIASSNLIVSKVKGGPLPDSAFRFVMEPAGNSLFARESDNEDVIGRRLLQLFIESADQGATLTELAARAGASEKTVQKHLDKLVEAQLVVKIEASATSAGRGRSPAHYSWSTQLQFAAGVRF